MYVKSVSVWFPNTSHTRVCACCYQTERQANGTNGTHTVPTDGVAPSRGNAEVSDLFGSDEEENDEEHEEEAPKQVFTREWTGSRWDRYEDCTCPISS